MAHLERCPSSGGAAAGVLLLCVQGCTPHRSDAAAAPPPASVTPAPDAASAEPSEHPAEPSEHAFVPIFLGDTEVESHFQQTPALTRPVQVTIVLVREEPKAFEELQRRTKKRPSRPGSLSFAADAYPMSHDRLLPKHRRASFVLDFDEPSVKAAHASAVALCGPSPTPDQLAIFVDRFIEHKDLLRPFDIASQVARRKEGDCTEHAVLLAALARSFGYPARVVFGIAIVPLDGKTHAVGHAWTEIYDGGSWRLADAAIPPHLGARYLPLEVMGDEGPAFGRHMFESSDPLNLVRRIVLDPIDAR